MDNAEKTNLAAPSPTKDTQAAPALLEMPKSSSIDVSKLDPNVNQVRAPTGQVVTLHREPRSLQDVKDNLAFYRVCAGLTQRAMGKAAGIGQAHIGLWESLRSPYIFSWVQAQKLSKLLNAPLAHLDPRDKPFSLKSDLGGYRYNKELLNLIHPPRALVDLKNNMLFYRKRMGFTLAQLADKMHEDKILVTRWESKNTLMWPDHDRLVLLATVLNAELADLDHTTFLENRDAADALPEKSDDDLRAVVPPRRLNQAKDNLRFYRLQLSLSKTELASKLGVPLIAVQAWEARNNHLWLNVVMRHTLAQVLKCSDNAFTHSSNENVEIYQPQFDPFLDGNTSAVVAKAEPSLQWALEALNVSTASKTSTESAPNATDLHRLSPADVVADPTQTGNMVRLAQACKLTPAVTYAVLTVTDDSLKESSAITKGDVVVIDMSQNDPRALAGALMAVALPNEQALVKYILTSKDDLVYANSSVPDKMWPMPKNSLVLGRVVAALKHFS